MASAKRATYPQAFEQRVVRLRIAELKPEDREELGAMGEKMLTLPISTAGSEYPYDTDAYLPWVRTLSLVNALTPSRQTACIARLGEGLDAALAMSVADPKRFPLDPLTDLDRQFSALYTLGGAVTNPLRGPWDNRMAALEKRVAERAEEIPGYVAGWSKAAREIRAKNSVPQTENQARLDKLLTMAESVGALEGFEKQSDGSWVYHYGVLGETEQSDWRVERFDASADFVVLNCIDPADSNMVITVPVAEFLSMADGQMEEFIERGIRNAESEAAGREAMEAYELPADRQIAHIRMLPRERKSNDPVVSSLFTSSMLATAMKQRYGDRIATQAPLFTDNPAEDLGLQVAAAHEEGSRHFVIDIIAHGLPGEIQFGSSANPDAKLTPADLIGIIRRFPDSTFTINTLACHGGGLIEGFMDGADADVAARAAVFTQTKGDVLNSAMDRAETPATPGQGDYLYGGSAYYVEMIANMPGNTYGGAARRADVASKRYGTDGSAIIGGLRISRGGRRATGPAAA